MTRNAHDDPITIHIVSDSLGETADMVARAAVSQFPTGTFKLERLPKVGSPSQVRDLVESHCGSDCVFFYTLARQELKNAMTEAVAGLEARAVDILGPAVHVLEHASGHYASQEAGAVRKTDRGYFERIEALEFAVAHDDGRHPEGLDEAEIVLIGVSRVSKTPLSMYLAFKGYMVANIPLVPGSEPPAELFDIDPRKVFGLVSDPDLLASIRSARMSDLGAYAKGYAQREAVVSDLETARGVMRKIGCIVVRTDNRAIEETAQEIIRYLDT